MHNIQQQLTWLDRVSDEGIYDLLGDCKRAYMDLPLEMRLQINQNIDMTGNIDLEFQTIPLVQKVLVLFQRIESGTICGSAIKEYKEKLEILLSELTINSESDLVFEA